MAGSGTAHLRTDLDPLLRVENLHVEFWAGRGRSVKAVTDVSLDVLPGTAARVIEHAAIRRNVTAAAHQRCCAAAECIRPLNARVSGEVAKISQRAV